METIFFDKLLFNESEKAEHTQTMTWILLLCLLYMYSLQKQINTILIITTAVNLGQLSYEPLIGWWSL